MQMNVIGIMEHFADSAAMIGNAIGVKKPTTTPTLNMSPSRVSSHLQTYRSGAGLSADTIKRIDELNTYNHELSEFGLNLFRRQQVSSQRRFFFSRQHG